MVNSYKIIIKTEASEQISLGNLKRMMVFGQYLHENKNNNVIYAINKDEIAKNCFEEKGYSSDYEYAESEAELIDIIKKHAADILIIDVQKLEGKTNYNFENIKKQAGIKKIVLLDKYVEDDFVDLMIFQGIQDDQFEEKVKNNSKVIFGLDCIFINNDFVKVKKERDEVDLNKKNEKEIVISFGGRDPRNLTVKVINQIKNMEIKFNVSFKIIIGPYYKNHVELFAALKDFKYNYHIIENPKNYAYQLINTDYAICAYGVSYYEFLYLNIPTSNFVINAQDVNILDKLRKMGMSFRLEELLSNPNKVLNNNNNNENENKMKRIINNIIKENV